MTRPVESPTPSRATLPPPKRRSRAWIWIIVAVAIAAVVYWFMRPKAADAPESGEAAGARRGAGGPGGRGGFPRMPIVVAVEAARTGDMPNYITALGTVTALNTVTVRSRVDGQLLKVNFEEGQPVKPGDVLAEIDPRPFEATLSQAQGVLARDRAQLENARADLQRYQNAQEAVTPQQVDAAKASVAQFEGAVKADEATVATATLNLSFCKVVAPIGGIAGLRQVDPGNLVRSSDTNGIVVITQIQPIAVRFSVPEDNLPAINRTLVAGEKVSIDVFDRTMKNKLASGEVSAVDNQIDPTTGTVKIKAVVPNEDLALFPNQFVNVRALLGVQRGVTLIPTSAIQIAGAERFVFVVGADTAVERRNIKVGDAEGLYSVAKEGVAPGDVVVTEGLDRLQPGSKVVARTPGQNNNEAPPQNPTQNGQRRRRNGGNGGSGAKGP